MPAFRPRDNNNLVDKMHTSLKKLESLELELESLQIRPRRSKLILLCLQWKLITYYMLYNRLRNTIHVLIYITERTTRRY